MYERRRFLQVLGGSVVLLGCSSGGGASGGTGGVGATGGTGAGGATGGAAGSGTGGAGGGCNTGAGQQGSNNDICGSNAGKFDVGTPLDYPNDGLYKVANQQSNALIGRDAGGLYAMSSYCTHQCCDMNGTIGGQQVGTITGSGIICNCHGSRFGADGSVAQGPATQPLQHYALTQECDGHLYVDTTQVVDNATRLQPSGFI